MSCGTTTLALSGSRTCSNATAIPRQVNSNTFSNYGSNYSRQPQPRCSTSTQVFAISATASPAEHSPLKVRCTTRTPLVDIPKRKIQLTPCSYLYRLLDAIRRRQSPSSDLLLENPLCPNSALWQRLPSHVHLPQRPKELRSHGYPTRGYPARHRDCDVLPLSGGVQQHRSPANAPKPPSSFHDPSPPPWSGEIDQNTSGRW
jgi:hypothetical protein